MSFDGPDVDNYGGDEDGHRKRDTSRKRDGKKDKKEKGYTMFEEEDSDGDSLVLADDLKSPSKAKGNKAKPFKFPVRKEKAKEKEEKKDKDAKKEEKEKRREEKEEKKLKKDKKKSKLHEPAVTIAAPGDYENPTFGVPLAVAVDRNKSHDGIELPTIVRECIDYIEECGLACEGIYRISGVKSKVQALKDSFNRHQPIYLYEHEPNIVASLLKQFLRDLPEPVLTTAMMPKFEEASTAKSNKKKVELFSKLIQELPACNRLLLSWMIVHMSHVIDLAKENKMTLQNVSIVLSPTMRISHRVLNILFSNVQALFGDVQLRKYVPPLRPAHSKWSLELPDNLSSLEEELAKQESLLNQLHTDLNSGLTDPVREEQLWEVQRVVTQLKRKIKMSKKGKDKDDGMRSNTDLSKRSSNASLPSLSAPEELRLDLKPVPVPQALSTTTAVVEKPQPSAKSDTKKEDTVYLESSKTVKFVEKPTETKRMSREIAEQAQKMMDKKIVRDGAKQDKVEIHEKASEKVEEDKRNAEVSEDMQQAEVKTDQEVKEEKESAIKDVDEGVKKDEEVHKENEHKKPEAVTDKSDRNDEKSEIPSSEATSVSEKEPNANVKEEKNTPDAVSEEKHEDAPKKSDEKCEERKELEPEDVKAKGEEANKKEVKDTPATTSSQKSESLSTTTTTTTTTATTAVPTSSTTTTTTTTATNQQRVAPVPPFMSLTPLEPVKAEIPTRRKSESETTMPENEEEEWRELEEELLGKKKDKKNKGKSNQDQDEEDLADDINTEQLLEDEYALVMEEEELMAIADELRQKMATERSEMERLAQEIQELHYLRQDSDLEDMSSDSNSSDESEDEDDLQDLLSQLIGDNQDLETKNAEMCQKIHEERMICLSVKLQIRLLQQQQLEASCG